MFEVLSPDSSREVHLSDIARVSVVKSASAYSGGFRVLPSDNYFHGKIHLNDGASILVTTLLDPDLIWLTHLDPNKTTVESHHFCFI